MDDISIRHRSDEHSPIEAERLAALVGARLCHDLVSPLGAIGNGLELLQISGDFPGIGKSAEMQLVNESVQAARARIRWFRMAFGHSAADQRVGLTELAGLLGDADRAGRIRIKLDAPGDLPRTEARMILLAFMCLETAMPWGGSVLICRGARGWRLVGESGRIKSDPALWAWLDMAEGQRTRTEPAASEVHFALLSAFARQANRPLTWELDDTGGEIAF